MLFLVIPRLEQDFRFVNKTKPLGLVSILWKADDVGPFYNRNSLDFIVSGEKTKQNGICLVGPGDHDCGSTIARFVQIYIKR